MPVRDAFRRLTSEGALEPLLSGAIRVPVYDFAKLQELTEIRLTVEGLAARRAAKHITREEFDALDRCTLEIERAVARTDFAAEAKANEHFHFVIYRAARSVELLRIIERLWLQMGPYLAWLIRQRTLPSRSHGARAFRHHKAIVSGLRRGDPEKTEAALRADLNTATEVLLKHASDLPPG
jgi:DNA-binding GntR family transcriptional regulator